MHLQPDLARMASLAAQAPLVPVWCECMGDAYTPLQAYAKLRRHFDTAFLLESVTGGDRWARYSFVGLGHRLALVGEVGPDGVVVVARPGGDLPIPAAPPASGIAAIRGWLAAFRAAVVPELPPFWGGLVGVWGHDMIRAVERLPVPAHQVRPPVPALELLATDLVLAFDNLAQRMYVVATALPELEGGVAGARAAAARRIERLLARLADPAAPILTPILAPPGQGRAAGTATVATAASAIAASAIAVNGSDAAATTGAATIDITPDAISTDGPHLAPGFLREHYLDAVVQAQAHIRRGDAFQIVLSQAFEQPLGELDPLAIYRMLRATNPAPYMLALQWPSADLVGASPEVLVRVDRDRQVTLRPIAGTRGRGANEAADQALERELLADPKERAEHLMLVDLGRNDMGRVAAPGSVVVKDSFVVERYSRVMHIVSEIRGRLRPDLDALDALCAAFPAGTLSGAPKVRALEIIDELEPVGRGWYGGAVGYLGYDGGADFAICIRAALAQGQTVRVQAGAGIVFDSVPAAEDAECHAKASAIWRAVALARNGGATP